VGFDICVGRISRYIEREYIGEFGDRNIRVQNSRRDFERNKEGVWRR